MKRVIVLLISIFIIGCVEIPLKKERVTDVAQDFFGTVGKYMDKNDSKTVKQILNDPYNYLYYSWLNSKTDIYYQVWPTNNRVYKKYGYCVTLEFILHSKYFKEIKKSILFCKLNNGNKWEPVPYGLITQ